MVTPSHGSTLAAIAHPRDGVAVPARSLPLGATIVTRDGKRLGRLKRWHGRCVKVDARFAFDYWLSDRAIGGIVDGMVVLGIDRRDVQRYLVDIDCPGDADLLPQAPSLAARGRGDSFPTVTGRRGASAQPAPAIA